MPAIQGGRGDIGAARILLRSAVGALLNAAHPDINTPYHHQLSSTMSMTLLQP